jgi:hypothetical protein
MDIFDLGAITDTVTLSNCTSVLHIDTINTNRMILSKLLLVLFPEYLAILPWLDLLDLFTIGPNPNLRDKRIKLDFEITLLLIS